MVDRRAALFQCGADEIAVGAGVTADSAGDRGVDCVTESVWARVENRSVVFQAAVGGALGVHGRGSVMPLLTHGRCA